MVHFRTSPTSKVYIYELLNIDNKKKYNVNMHTNINKYILAHPGSCQRTLSYPASLGSLTGEIIQNKTF